MILECVERVNERGESLKLCTFFLDICKKEIRDWAGIFNIPV